jgi:hypothetical protein
MNEKELAIEILNLCLRINKETGFCAFFEFSGHIDAFRVTVRKGKDNWGTYLFNENYRAISGKDELRQTVLDIQNFLDVELVERYQITVSHNYINWNECVDASALRQVVAQLESLGVPANKIETRLIKLHRARFQDQDFYSDEL